jgi:AAA ATPase domain
MFLLPEPAPHPAVDETGSKRQAGGVWWLRERERERAAIEALLLRGGGVLLVEGRAGIGKTSLVEAACSRADALGQVVLRARGSELEAGFAFGVVRQLFERRLAGAVATPSPRDGGAITSPAKGDSDGDDHPRGVPEGHGHLQRP